MSQKILFILIYWITDFPNKPLKLHWKSNWKEPLEEGMSFEADECGTCKDIDEAVKTLMREHTADFLNTDVEYKVKTITSQAVGTRRSKDSGIHWWGDLELSTGEMMQFMNKLYDAVEAAEERQSKAAKAAHVVETVPA